MESSAENVVNINGERESDKLLSMPLDDTSTSTKQKYVNSSGQDLASQGQNLPRGGVSSVGDHLSVADTRSTNSKTTDFQQLKIAEDEQNLKKNWKRKVLKVIVTLMFIVMVVVVIVVWTLHESGSGYMKEDGYFVFDIVEFKLTVEVEQYETSFEVALGGDGFKNEKKDDCENSNHKYCYILRKGGTLYINSESFENIQCYTVTWSEINEYVPEDCFDLQYGLWYGMLNTVNPSGQLWPIRDLSLSKRLYFPGINPGIGDVMDYYWISSTGTTIYVHNDSPIEMRFNVSADKKICISPPVGRDMNEKRSLKYMICQSKNIKEVQSGMNKYLYRTSFSYNTTGVVLNPSVLWNLDAQGSVVTSDTLLEFQQNLSNNNVTCGLLEVNDWEGQYGDLTVSQSKFTNFDTVSQSLGKLSCQLVLDLAPACDFRSNNFLAGIEEGWFIMDPDSVVTKLFLYEGRQSAIWDVRLPLAVNTVEKYVSVLTRSYNVGMFWLQRMPNFEVTRNESVSIGGTSELYKQWVSTLSNVSTMSLTLVKSTFRSQNDATMVEVFFQKQTSWTGSQGSCISNSVPNALTIGLYGYPLLLSSFANLTTMNEELYIRWIQVSTFFPLMRISSTFLQFEDKIVNYTREMIDLHYTIISKLSVMGKMNDLSPSVPLLRPLWWLTPEDFTALTINDEFMVADVYLVAPVFCSGARSRNIYLPVGDFQWLYRGADGSEKVLNGGWHLDFSVPLYSIAYFEKV